MTTTARNFQATCQARCTFARCTGKGDRVWTSHRCALAPAVELDRPPCQVPSCDSTETTRYVNGWLCPEHKPPTSARVELPPPSDPSSTPRSYGPHDPDTAPATVSAFTPGKWPVEVEVPRHPALIRQREQLNARAAGSP